MPPSMKTLKFDLTLMTGTFQQNMKRCFDTAKKAWEDFGKNMKKSNSFLDASNAIYMFGKQGVEAITSLFHPYEALVGKVAAVGVAVKKACENFEQFEKAGLKASYAFKGRGGTHDMGKFQKQVMSATEGGMGNATEVMGAVANARQENFSLNDKELEFAIEMSKDLAAIQGGDMASAVETLTDLLHKESVSADELAKAGLVLNRQEFLQIDALNKVETRELRNIEVMKLYRQQLKGAADEEAKTLGGMYKRMANTFENLKMKLGQAIAPLAKPFFQLAVLIMNLAEGFVKPFVGIAKVIGAVFSPLTKLLTQCSGLCKFIGTTLGVIVSVWLANWIKSQATILALTIKTAVAQRALKVSPRMQAIANASLGTPARGFGFKPMMETTKLFLYKLTGGAGVKAGMKSVGGLALSGLAGAGGGVMKIVSLALKGLGAISRFAGPLGLVVTVAMSAYKFVQGFVKGWLDAFNSASGSSASLMDILKRVGKIIMSLVNVILAPFNLLFKLFGKLGYLIGWLGGKIGAILLPIIEKTVGALEKAKNAVADKAKEAYFWGKEKLGFDVSKERAEWEKQKAERDNPQKKPGNDTDPRINFSSSFEGAASMTQRIQTAIVSKNSPQAKMVDYLHDIREGIKAMNAGQTKQVEAQKEDNALMKEQNKKLGNLEPGLA